MQCCLPSFGFCCCGQIALKDLDFLVLSPARHTEIALKNLSFLGNKPEMGVDYGVFSLTCMGLCSVREHAHTYEGIRPGVSIHSHCHPASASEQTERPFPPSCYTNALVQAAGELLWETRVQSDSPRAAGGGGGGGLGELGKQTERVQGPVRGLQLHCCLAPWRQQSCPSPKHPLGAPAGSPAPQEKDLALMASTICHKSQGRRTQRTELLFPWQRRS